VDAVEIVQVVEYNPDWLVEYEQEKMKISAALKDVNKGIEHIGSTSIVGLAAKPVIDIMVGVLDLAELKQIHVEELGRLGYEYVEHSHFPERRFFRRGVRRAGTHHLHVYTHNGEHWKANLLFRNYIMSHPEAHKAYSELKKSLELQYQYDRAAYTKAKQPFIQELLRQAVMDY
jgi:GrpB-like predicted nucleotidyltransferase (UPF0157 family)